MSKNELAKLVADYGDAIITYRSENYKKLKYNVCTIDFSTPYIQDKKNRAKESDIVKLHFLTGGTNVNPVRTIEYFNLIAIYESVHNIAGHLESNETFQNPNPFNIFILPSIA